MTPLLLTRLGALVLALTYVAGCAISPGSAKWRDKSNVLLAAQEKNAEQLNAIGVKKKVIYAAFALHSDSTAFQGDVTLVWDVLRSINSQMSVLLLSNQLEHSDIVYPFAAKENIESALSKVARLADKDTLVILLFTSHGSPNQLSLKIGYGAYSNNLGTEELRSYLEDLKAIPTIIIISACYSGSFVPALANDNRIIITAASKDRVSFGCSSESKATYFIEEFFQHSFDASMSLSQLFSQASRQVAERERREHFTGSQPTNVRGGTDENICSCSFKRIANQDGGKTIGLINTTFKQLTRLGRCPACTMAS